MNVAELVGVMKKEEVLEKTKMYDEAQVVEIELGKRLKFSVNPSNDFSVNLGIDSKESELNTYILKTLASNVSISSSYIDKVPKERREELLVPILNYFYTEKLAGSFLRLLNDSEGKAIMVIPNADFEHIKISDVISAIEIQLGEDVIGYHKFSNSAPGIFELSAITKQEVQVVDGDIFNTGIRVRHDLSGKNATSLSAYMFRQFCTNGATTEDQIGNWSRRKAADNIMTWLSKSIQVARQAFPIEVNRLKHLIEIPVNVHTREVLQSILNKSAVPIGLQKEVFADVVGGMPVEKQPKNLYDVYNLLTQLDTHSKFFDDQKNVHLRGKLDKVAAKLSYNSKLCPSCYSVLTD